MKSISDLSKRWDWSNVTAELVPSIAGKWEGWKKIKTFGYFCDVINPSNSSSRTGHPRLMRALETLGLATNKTQNLVVECQVRFSIFLLYLGLNVCRAPASGFIPHSGSTNFIFLRRVTRLRSKHTWTCPKASARSLSTLWVSRWCSRRLRRSRAPADM